MSAQPARSSPAQASSHSAVSEPRCFRKNSRKLDGLTGWKNGSLAERLVQPQAQRLGVLLAIRAQLEPVRQRRGVRPLAEVDSHLERRAPVPVAATGQQRLELVAFREERAHASQAGVAAALLGPVEKDVPVSGRSHVELDVAVEPDVPVPHDAALDLEHAKILGIDLLVAQPASDLLGVCGPPVAERLHEQRADRLRVRLGDCSKRGRAHRASPAARSGRAARASARAATSLRGG